MALSIAGAAGTLLLAAGAVLATAPPAGDLRGDLPRPLAESAAPGYRWPTGEPAQVARAFAAPGERWARGHRGVDLRAPAGAMLVAPADGVVTFSGPVAGRGVIALRHRDGLVTTYEPVLALVRGGDVVAAGEAIGTLSDTGSHCAPEPCLHWGARTGPDDYVDPLALLSDRVTLRLYPDEAQSEASGSRVGLGVGGAQALG